MAKRTTQENERNRPVLSVSEPKRTASEPASGVMIPGKRHTLREALDRIHEERASLLKRLAE
jgi:hypothetical protein